MRHVPYYRYTMPWPPTSSSGAWGGGGGGGEASTSWAEKYGGDGYGSSGGPPSSIDIGDFLPQYNDIDRGEITCFSYYGGQW